MALRPQTSLCSCGSNSRLASLRVEDYAPIAISKSATDTGGVEACQECRDSMTEFYICDHPELLTKDNQCLLCLELAGQTDLLGEIQ